SGPTYPEAFDWFNGQGIPDSFAATPLHPRRGDDPSVLVLGVGLCRRDLSQVIRFDEWTVESRGGNTVINAVTHRTDDMEIRISRTVVLLERTVISSTTVTNSGDDQFTFTWFPHPFFPPTPSAELVCFSASVSIPEGAPSELKKNGFISRSRELSGEGDYAALAHESVRGMTIMQRHPQLGLVAAQIDFVPSLLPIWGNDRTFSWEPHHDRSLAAGESSSWEISYHF